MNQNTPTHFQFTFKCQKCDKEHDRVHPSHIYMDAHPCPFCRLHICHNDVVNVYGLFPPVLLDNDLIAGAICYLANVVAQMPGDQALGSVEFDLNSLKENVREALEKRANHAAS